MLEVSMTVRVPGTDRNIIGRFDHDHLQRVRMARFEKNLHGLTTSVPVPGHALEDQLFRSKETGIVYRCGLCCRVWIRTGYMIHTVLEPVTSTDMPRMLKRFQLELVLSETSGALHEQELEDRFYSRYEEVTSDAERTCVAEDAAWQTHSI